LPSTMLAYSSSTSLPAAFNRGKEVNRIQKCSDVGAGCWTRLAQ
jgi:hypothetical protein